MPNSGYKQKASRRAGQVVTIFALHMDNFIMTPNLLPFTSFVNRDLPARLTPVGWAKIAPWCLARRDTFVAKEPGLVTGVTLPPTLSSHTRNRNV
ncbi:MAG: hypothetical protein IPJ37_08750 [Bacteroidales bacterium]|nr:hypothetical protein [Bacteroidales bacterium]